MLGSVIVSCEDNGANITYIFGLGFFFCQETFLQRYIFQIYFYIKNVCNKPFLLFLYVGLLNMLLLQHPLCCQK